MLLCVFGLICYGSYRKGYSDAARRAITDRAAEYGNDLREDASANHSASYSLGYQRGHETGYAETRKDDFVQCGQELAQFAVAAGKPKLAAKLLVDGYVAPSQLEAAAAADHK